MAVKPKKVTELGLKEEIEDSDLFVAGSKGTSALVGVKWANMLSTVKNKIASWAFAELTTTNKTLPGAIEEVKVKQNILNAQIEDVSNQFTGVSGVSNIHAIRIGKKVILNFHTSVTGNVVTTQTLKPIDTYGMYVTAINGVDLLKLKYGFGLATGVFLVSVRESYSLVATTELDGRASCVCIYDIA